MNEMAQTTAVEMERKALQDRIVRGGKELWNRQQEHIRAKKLQEQKEIREMLHNHWPWSRSSDVRPRGLRNLRLEELFPNKDYENAKRYVGTLDLGRPGGGAPIVNKTGTKLTRTREDPILRFQFGSTDLRRCVDNKFRYKTNKSDQMEYKKQLDEMVAEKKLKRQKEKENEQLLDQRQGWSSEQTLKNDVKKTVKISPSNSLPRKHFINAGKYRKLSPLSHGKDNGVELVTLMAKERQNPVRIPLCSTDVTRGSPDWYNTIRFRQGSAYLKELSQQIMSKQQKSRDLKVVENERSCQHFSTWDSFWGRPRNGAPRSAIRKQHLDRLLYPAMVPISVH